MTDALAGILVSEPSTLELQHITYRSDHLLPARAYMREARESRSNAII